MKEIEPISLDDVKCYPLSERRSLVTSESFASRWEKGGSLGEWLKRLPRMLAARDFIEVTERIANAASEKRTVILAMGAHPIKVGLSPILIDLMRKGIISAVALNGAGIIHDSEVAMVGRTSEDVAEGLGRGRFGMAEETGRILNQAITRGAEKGWGLGKSVGTALLEADFPFNELSVLATACKMGVPVTVHVAIGTDIIHVHPTADGAATGKTSHTDFRIFARMVSTLNGGVFINLGSAVILPEVFLKALTLVRNLGYEVDDFTTVNMDFIRHYRPMTNVVNRPGGKGYNLTGHHELMFPLLAAAVMEKLGADYFEEKELLDAHI